MTEANKLMRELIVFRDTEKHEPTKNILRRAIKRIERLEKEIRTRGFRIPTEIE